MSATRNHVKRDRFKSISLRIMPAMQALPAKRPFSQSSQKTNQPNCSLERIKQRNKVPEISTTVFFSISMPRVDTTQSAYNLHHYWLKSTLTVHLCTNLWVLTLMEHP